MSDQYDYERIANIEKLLDQIDKHRDGLEDRIDALETTTGPFVDGLTAWQLAYDKQMQDLLKQWNEHTHAFDMGSVEELRDTYNRHLKHHTELDTQMNQLSGVVNHNAKHLDKATLVGGVAMAGLALVAGIALGRSL